MNNLSIITSDEMRAEHSHERDGNAFGSSICILQVEQYTSSLGVLF